MKKKTFAFDVYGTLIDTIGIATALAEYTQQPQQVAQKWREKQLEYAFRRGLMRRYVDFAVCTAQALDYVAILYKIALSADDKNKLMQAYKKLPAFPEVPAALEDLRNHKLFAFSNGSHNAIKELLKNASLDRHFRAIISVEDLRSFKPDPAVYHHFLTQAAAAAEESWMISGNPFDVLGALSAGMNAVWVRRDKNAVFDNWDMEPTLVVSSLSELPQAFS